MLPFVLVLVLTSSAFAAPSVSVTAANINSIEPVRDNGALVSSYLTNHLFEVVDGGDINIYTVIMQQILDDLANQPNDQARATAVSQCLAILGELATGIPGDACDAAAMINAYTSGRGDANAARAYIARIVNAIDMLTTLAINPNALRYSTGPRGNCAGGGRYYEMENCWTILLNRTPSSYLPLMNEEYCAVRRLYQSTNVRNNNVGAAATAAAIPSVVEIIHNAIGPVTNFIRVVISGANPSAAAEEARTALLR